MMLLMTAPIFLIAWTLVLTTRSVEVLYIVRIIQGLGLGTINTVLPLYLAEISGTEIRATLGYFFQGIWYAGNLYEYSIGPFVDYQSLAWISIIPPLVFLVVFLPFPETPYYLMMKGREEDAGRSLAWLRGVDKEDGVAEELSAMKESAEAEAAAKASWRDILGTRQGRRALVIVVLVAASYIMCGGTALFSYSTDTFSKTGASGVSADLYTIVMGVSVLAAVPFSGVAVDRMGRRPVLLISSLGSAVCLSLTSVYYYLSFNTVVDLSSFYWSPYFLIISYTVLIGSGVEAIVPVLQAELFPNTTRGLASGLSYFLMTLMSFFCLKMYQVVTDSLGLYFLYGSFAFFAFLGSAYIFFFVPETKGLTFAEIQDLLGPKKEPMEAARELEGDETSYVSVHL
ncbi:hypothetical protein AAG570_004760 [Ranatra chinensis]|uniref:Major facilitator superfamily (MFS) profile domain-containing protein n=1 Tax=Ranatra chinensis TaxID=642074 RepID=A0ABD0YNM1_9HEMI